MSKHSTEYTKNFEVLCKICNISLPEDRMDKDYYYSANFSMALGYTIVEFLHILLGFKIIYQNIEEDIDFYCFILENNEYTIKTACKERCPDWRIIDKSTKKVQTNVINSSMIAWIYKTYAKDIDFVEKGI